MIPTQEIIEILNTHLTDIRKEFGPDWLDFCQELAQLRDVVDGKSVLREIQTDDDALWRVCCRYPFVKGFILGCDASSSRQLPADDDEDDLEIDGTLNRFQSLLAKMARLNQSEASADKQTKELGQLGETG